MPGDTVISTTAALAAVPVPGAAAEAAQAGERNLPPPVAGLYGKLPARGDFVGRRLPAAFVEVWDHFLNAGLTEAASQLGGAFADRYLVSPFWRFALAPGVAGPGTMVGVFAPSVDRVGRYFPLTAAVELPGGIGPSAALAAAESWLPFAEQLIFDALMPDGSLEALDEGIAALPIALPPTATAIPGGRLIETSLLAPGLAALAVSAEAPVLFWTLGSVDLSPRLLSFGALPSPTVFAAFLDGAWEGKQS